MNCFIQRKAFYFSDSEWIFPVIVCVAHFDGIGSRSYLFFYTRSLQIDISSKWLEKICPNKSFPIKPCIYCSIPFYNIYRKIGSTSWNLWYNKTHIQQKSRIRYDLIYIFLPWKNAVKCLRNFGILDVYHLSYRLIEN